MSAAYRWSKLIAQNMVSLLAGSIMQLSMMSHALSTWSKESGSWKWIYMVPQ